MRYRRVGRTELEVSELGLGGWRTLGDGLDEASSHRLLDAARDHGITLFDLADSYANGEAERVVGRWLRGKDRSRLVVTTKVFWPTGPGPEDRGLGRRHVLDAVQRSLKNLATDYIDVYFCHREDPSTPLLETATVFDELVKAGKIRHWGTSVWRPQRTLLMHFITRTRGLTPPRVEQPPYNYLERWAEKRTLPLSRWLGMGAFTYSPLAGGLLSGKYGSVIPAGSRASQDPDLAAKLRTHDGALARRFAEVAARHGVDPAALALAWILRRADVSSALIGATSTEQLARNVRATELELTRAIIDDLEAARSANERPETHAQEGSSE